MPEESVEDHTTMPTPVSNGATCAYQPQPECDPTNTTCGPSTADSSPLSDTALAPVVIHADPGVQRLVQGFDAARRSPDCSMEAQNATLACAKMGLTAAGTLASSGTVILGALGVAATFVEAFACGKELRAYYECQDQ